MSKSDYSSFVEENLSKLPDEHFKLPWIVFGLVSEAGEVAAELEKAARKGRPVNVDAVIDELGDVLFWSQALATKLGITLDEIKVLNMKKLEARVEQSKISKED